MDPAEVARRVLAAIRNEELYVFTHPVMRGVVEERFRAILAAFDRTAAPPFKTNSTETTAERDGS